MNLKTLINKIIGRSFMRAHNIVLSGLILLISKVLIQLWFKIPLCLIIQRLYR